MSQVKIYGVEERLLPIRNQLSNVIRSCVVDTLQFPGMTGDAIRLSYTVNV